MIYDQSGPSMILLDLILNYSYFCLSKHKKNLQRPEATIKLSKEKKKLFITAWILYTIHLNEHAPHRAEE